MLEDAMIAGTSLAVLVALLRPRLWMREVWRAIVTPLVSIIGNGFLIPGPILFDSYGCAAPLAMGLLCALAWAFGTAIRHNIARLDRHGARASPAQRGLGAACDWRLPSPMSFRRPIAFTSSVHLRPAPAHEGPGPPPPRLSGWESLSLLLRLITAVQEFGTSCHLGGGHSAPWCTRSTRQAQVFSSLIQLAFLVLISWLLPPGQVPLTESGVIAFRRFVAPLLLPLLISAALFASSVEKDTIPAGSRRPRGLSQPCTDSAARKVTRHDADARRPKNCRNCRSPACLMGPIARPGGRRARNRRDREQWSPEAVRPGARAHGRRRRSDPPPRIRRGRRAAPPARPRR
ncbi:hypothetical protein SAMN05216257_104143 [Meinhardsimonia xiamenensis]|uniref:Uncharacterized protein n=1 Tax=Meinhardsimonia xiamenensis TaxID=990712 RepID=A0A1G9E413_9RHOB|nr:hypothetical protein LV81_02371 [Meinhardsimonia xiamenensis]SDK70871.1 hypothetical protein SAMN05216257_104143 [Meinhardsimonia xiamenensis]